MKNDIFCEFDEYQAAMRKIDLTEMTLPIYHGRFLQENVEVYGKMQKILACPKMINCHQFIYDLDPENLTEAECAKVCNLFKLGVQRGLITDNSCCEDDDEKADAEPKNECGEISAVAVVEPAKTEIVAKPAPQVTQPAPKSAWVVLYSAVRNGMIKTGEAYSNAINTRAAKEDVLAKLDKAGYQSIQLLAIEAADPDHAGNTNACLPAVEAERTDAEKPDAEATEAETRDDNEAVKSAEVKEDDSASTEEVKSDDAEKTDDAESTKTQDSDATDDQDSEKTDGDDLSASEKGRLKDAYKKAFKATLQKCKFEVCFADLNLEQKVKFFTELSKAWSDEDHDPSEFMTDKETEQLEQIVVKKTV